MNAELLSVGTELLLGDILNTNAKYLSHELANLGISVYYQSTVGDNSKRLADAYEIAFSRSDLVITTGGLGPTDDDITKEIACEYFGKELVLDEFCENHIKEYYKDRCMPETNIKQAYIPKGAKVLINDNGTANGFMINENGKILIMLPGPPDEVVPMFRDVVKPILRNLTNSTIISKNIHLSGIGESRAAEMITDLVKNSKNPTVAPYAKPNGVLFRVTAKCETVEESLKTMEPTVKEIYDRMGEYIFGEGDTTLVEAVMKKAIEKNITVSVAESCTGGLVSSQIVDFSGASKVFKNGVVSYSNCSKVKFLGVSEEILSKYGAVSEETAIEMAKGIAHKSDTDIGISTTGIAGPDGGSEEKPVGLAYVCLYSKKDEKVITNCLKVKGNREKIRARVANEAIEILRKYLS